MIRTSLPRQARQSTVLPSPNTRLRVRVRLQSGQKKTFKLSLAKCTIGGHPDCTIRIPVSGEETVQCVLLRSRGKMIVRSWSNACTLNGRKFEISNLVAGDLLRVDGCSIRILKNRKEAKKPARTVPDSDKVGKLLVKEIGKRLAHLEHRLVDKQNRLAKRLESSAAQKAAALELETPAPAPAPIAPTIHTSLPSPAVMEGLATLRSAVEELRTRVEDVAVRPWPIVEPAPAIDAAALVAAASNKMGEIVDASLREDRTQSAVKFEQISREFDRIGNRLGEVEQKLNLPLSSQVADQIRPVSDAVEFVRTGLQAIEDRQSLETSRFDKLATGLDSLRQSTIERLAAMTDRLGSVPSFTKVEDAIASVSSKVEDLSKELAHRSELYFTRADAASLLVQLESAQDSRNQLEQRFSEIGQHFAGMRGEWSSFQAGTQEQLEAIASRIESMPSTAMHADQPPVDLAPLEQGLMESNAKLSSLEHQFSDYASRQSHAESRLEATYALIEELRTVRTDPPTIDLSPLEQGLLESHAQLKSIETQLSDYASKQSLAESRLDATSMIVDKLRAARTDQPTVDLSPLVQGLTDSQAQLQAIEGQLRDYASKQNLAESRLDATCALLEELRQARADQPPVDLSPLAQGLSDSQAQLRSIENQLDEYASKQGIAESRLESTNALVEDLRIVVAATQGTTESIGGLSQELSTVRELAQTTAEQVEAARCDLINQLIALETRCVHLESELLRLSQQPVVHSFAPRPETTAEDAEPTINSTYEPLPAMESYTPLATSAYYSQNVATELSESTPDADLAAEPTAAPRQAEVEETASSALADSAPFGTQSFARGLSPSLAHDYEADEPQSADSPEETSASVSDSVVERLRRSGIWKEETESDADSDTAGMDDPRDVVGSSYQPEPTPPSMPEPEVRPAEAKQPAGWSAPHHEPAENEDESIDAYMERLLQRVAGNGTGEVTSAMAVAEHLQRAKAEAAAKKREARPEQTDGEFEYTPRGAAPEKSTDLSALRELAMTSANANIQNYHAASRAKTANEKWIVVVVAMICAMGLLYVCVNYKSDWTYIAAGVAFVVALYWAIQASLTTVAAKKLSKNPTKAAEKSLGAANVEPKPPARRRNDAELKSLLDQPSAGETFQALVAEREKEQQQDAEVESGAASDQDFYRTLDQLMPKKQPPR